ncbi:hypothetical protein L9F63_020943 [Diploptera punctata]|uniref:Uncharacterized protein n=1 Tax=Diploptera punctata TaxID=6984 RepID=A0AAD8EBU2_DIPPU|nr:hypothetical protein L9F63_020943 [Diploptera punctata]
MATVCCYNRYCGCPKGERNAREGKTGSERCNPPLSPPSSSLSPPSQPSPSPSVASTTSHQQLESLRQFYLQPFSMCTRLRVFSKLKCV